MVINISNLQFKLPIFSAGSPSLNPWPPAQAPNILPSPPNHEDDEDEQRIQETYHWHERMKSDTNKYKHQHFDTQLKRHAMQMFLIKCCKNTTVQVFPFRCSQKFCLIFMKRSNLFLRHYSRATFGSQLLPCPGVQSPNSWDPLPSKPTSTSSEGCDGQVLISNSMTLAVLQMILQYLASETKNSFGRWVRW